MEVPLAIVGAEERADRAVSLEGQKRARLPIESGSHLILPDDLEHITSHRSVAQQLRLRQVLVSRRIPKLRAVLAPVLVERFGTPKPRRPNGVRCLFCRDWAAA